jgi:hypothetical protein
VSVEVNFRLGEFTYVVEEQEATYRGGEEKIKVMVLGIIDQARGIVVSVPLAADPPPTGLPNGQQPPALEVAALLTGDKPQIIRATSMPPMPPPGRPH